MRSGWEKKLSIPWGSWQMTLGRPGSKTSIFQNVIFRSFKCWNLFKWGRKVPNRSKYDQNRAERPLVALICVKIFLLSLISADWVQNLRAYSKQWGTQSYSLYYWNWRTRVNPVHGLKCIKALIWCVEGPNRSRNDENRSERSLDTLNSLRSSDLKGLEEA